MLSHISHLLQPLDVGCFSPLKAAYRNQIHELARQRVFYIDKVDFLQIYLRIRNTVLSAQNIHAGFRASGLVPACPERVLSSLTVVRTPSPPRTLADAEGAWVAGTPSNIDQLQRQARYVQDLLRRSSQSPSTLAMRKIVKGCELAMQSNVILAVEVSKLRQTLELCERKQR